MSEASIGAGTLAEVLRRFAQARVWVVGDVMLDEYIAGDVRRVSPDAPVQVVNVRETFHRLGGAANVAHGVAALGGRVELVGAVGNDDAGAMVRDGCARYGVGVGGLWTAEGRPTTRKVRVLARRQHVLRMDWESSEPLPDAATLRSLEALARVGAPSVIVVSDYAKGLLSDGVLAWLVAYGAKSGVPVVVDPKRRDFSGYRGATVLTPNTKELALAVGATWDDSVVEQRIVEEAARSIVAQLDARVLVVTMGERGMLVVPAAGPSVAVRAVAREVYDVTGAGDTVVASLALGVAAGLPVEQAAQAANLAAGIAVQKVGTAVVTPSELAAALDSELVGKVVDRAGARERVGVWKLSGKRVVFTNGCFDLLHVGHVSLLRAAKAQGDLLVVGINSDASVARLKGPERPLIPAAERAHLLAALDCVDLVTVFDEDTPLAILEELVPHVLVKGADYRVEDVVGREVIEGAGGRVVLVPLVADRSTSGLVERMKKPGS